MTALVREDPAGGHDSGVRLGRVDLYDRPAVVMLLREADTAIDTARVLVVRSATRP